MIGFYSGDLGESKSFISIRGSRSVWDHLKIRLPKTLLLLVPGTLIGFWLGIWLGKRVAWGRKGWLDFVATFGGTAFYSAFPPWLAFVAVQVFGLSLGWFPPEKPIDYNKWLFQDVTVDGIIWKMLITMGIGLLVFGILTNLPRRIVRMNTGLRTIIGFVIAILATIPWIIADLWIFPVDIIYHLILPMTTLVLLSFGETMIVMKTSMVETMESDHVAAAKGRGLADADVRDKHVARLSVLPVLSRFIVHLPFVLIGSFVLESFFYWDGIGQALFKAAQENDLQFLMSTLSLVGIGILIGHIILDIITVRLDPRLRNLEQAN
jgi:peptide/nickel transport system permease protein